MRWNETVTLEFVKIYLKHECLWNPSHPGYKVKYQRDKAYADIASEFQLSTMKNLSIPEIKIKIKNLRTTYVQQVHKILQKSSPNSIYQPSLIWFHEMDQYMKNIPTNRHSALYSILKHEKHTFDHWNYEELPFILVCLSLSKKLINQKKSDPLKIYKVKLSLSIGSQPQDSAEVDSSCQIWVDQDLQNGNVEESNSNPLNTPTDTEYDSSKPEDSLSTIKKEADYSSPSYKKVKKKKMKHQSSEQDYSTDSTSESVGVEDEFDIYGKYIASQLRKMDLHKALRLQLEIHTLVSEARISELTNDS